MGSRAGRSVGVAHGLRCCAAWEIFPNQGLNLCPLHMQADFYPLYHCCHQGRSISFSIEVYFTCCKIYLFHGSNSSSVYFWLLGIVDMSFSFVWLNDTYFGLCQVLLAVCAIFSCVTGSLGCSMWDLVPWSGIKPGPPCMGNLES